MYHCKCAVAVGSVRKEEKIFISVHKYTNTHWTAEGSTHCLSLLHCRGYVARRFVSFFDSDGVPQFTIQFMYN